MSSEQSDVQLDPTDADAESESASCASEYNNKAFCYLRRKKYCYFLLKK